MDTKSQRVAGNHIAVMNRIQLSDLIVFVQFMGKKPHYTTFLLIPLHSSRLSPATNTREMQRLVEGPVPKLGKDPEPASFLTPPLS